MKHYTLRVTKKEADSCIDCPLHTTAFWGMISFCPAAMKVIEGYKTPEVCPLKETPLPQTKPAAPRSLLAAKFRSAEGCEMVLAEEEFLARFGAKPGTDAKRVNVPLRYCPPSQRAEFVEAAKYRPMYRTYEFAGVERAPAFGEDGKEYVMYYHVYFEVMCDH